MRAPRLARLSLVAAVVLGAGTSPARAANQCDTDPDAVFFEPTVDPSGLNNALAMLGDVDANPGNPPMRVPGLCVDHQVTLSTGFVTVPLAGAAFTVTPGPGSLAVDLLIPGPFQLGIDGGSYQAVNCASACVINLPYVGEVFNGCNIEAGIVGPVLGVLRATASFDDLAITQVADTCVLGDCTVASPLTSSTADVMGFDVNLTGVGTCPVFLDFPDPFPDLGPFDPCDGIDPLMEAILEPVIEDGLAAVLVDSTGEGALIKVFARQIAKDGCANIPEVDQCLAGQPVAGMVRGTNSPTLNAALYVLPVGFILAIGARRRRRSGDKRRSG